MTDDHPNAAPPENRRPLNDLERQELVSLETTIEQGLATFVDVGRALLTIRDSRLYRQDFPTFEDYCRERWGFSDRRARQLIEGAGIGTIVPVQNEGQARELAPLKDDEREIVEAWREAKEAAAAEGKQLSARVVRNAVQKRVNRIKREREADERRAEPIEAVVAVEDSQTLHGDFRKVLDYGEHTFAGATVITDPPYPREFLPLWKDLAEYALGWGCDQLVAMSGQTYLPEVLSSILAARDPITGDGWNYRWTGAYMTVGPATRVHQPMVGTSWKPILVFDAVVERDFLTTDVFRSTGDDKKHHHWGQNENGIAALVEAFTEPGELVVDPFMGGGTTAVVCKALGRRFVGCDVDSDAVQTTRERLAA